MSITFVAVLTLLTAGAKSSDDNVFYSDTAGVGTGGVDDEWADEALLDVAFYLRLHKFDDFDRRFYLEKDENNSYFNAQFPVPPLMTFHWEVYEQCSKDFLTCLQYLHGVVSETQLQRTSSTPFVIRQMKWTSENQSGFIRMVNDECLRLKKLDWTKPVPFRGPLDRFRWRVTASYFMCWYTMQDVTLLSRFNEPCDDVGECYLPEKLRDFRADNSVPYQCAMYSFCPDQCCPLRQVAANPAACQDVNPCRHATAGSGCRFVRNQNTWLPSIIYNEWNVSCTCNPGYEWDSRYGTCVDVDECTARSETCDAESETCVNLPGRYKCICRWGFMWSADQRICVPDAAVKRAEIRFALRYDSDLEISTSIAGTNFIWTFVKNFWHSYLLNWMFK